MVIPSRQKEQSSQLQTEIIATFTLTLPQARDENFANSKMEIIRKHFKGR